MWPSVVGEFLYTTNSTTSDLNVINVMRRTFLKSPFNLDIYTIHSIKLNQRIYNPLLVQYNDNNFDN